MPLEQTKNGKELPVENTRARSESPAPNPEMVPSISALCPVAASPAPARSGLCARHSDDDDDYAAAATARRKNAAVAKSCQQAQLREEAVPQRLDAVIQAAAAAAVPGPDIQWQPSYESYLRRAAALKAAAGRPGRAKKTLPEGYPQRVEKPWVWSGGEMSADRYVVWLSENDVAQIEEALGFFKGELVL